MTDEVQRCQIEAHPKTEHYHIVASDGWVMPAGQHSTLPLDRGKIFGPVFTKGRIR